MLKAFDFLVLSKICGQLRALTISAEQDIFTKDVFKADISL